MRCLLLLAVAATVLGYQPQLRITSPHDNDKPWTLHAAAHHGIFVTAWFPATTNFTALLPIRAGLLATGSATSLYNFDNKIESLRQSNVFPRRDGNGTDIQLMLAWKKPPGSYHRVQVVLLYGNNGKEVKLGSRSAMSIPPPADDENGKAMPMKLVMDPATYLLSQIIDFTLVYGDEEKCTLNDTAREHGIKPCDTAPYPAEDYAPLPAPVRTMDMRSNDTVLSANLHDVPVHIVLPSVLKWCQSATISIVNADVSGTHQASLELVRSELVAWVAIYTHAYGDGTACEEGDGELCFPHHQRLYFALGWRDGDVTMEASFYPDPSSRYYEFVFQVW